MALNFLKSFKGLLIPSLYNIIDILFRRLYNTWGRTIAYSLEDWHL